MKKNTVGGQIEKQIQSKISEWDLQESGLQKLQQSSNADCSSADSPQSFSSSSSGRSRHKRYFARKKKRIPLRSLLSDFHYISPCKTKRSRRNSCVTKHKSSQVAGCHGTAPRSPAMLRGAHEVGPLVLTGLCIQAVPVWDLARSQLA